MSKDVALGDVVVATVVDSYLEHSKAMPGATEQTFDFQLGGEPFRCSGDLIKAVQNLEFAHSGRFQNWLDDCAVSLAALVPERVQRKLIKAALLRPQTSLHEGHMASGVTVGAATTFIDWLKKQRDRNYLALEMEAGGVLAAVFEEVDPRRSLVLRGISDLADERKAELDKIKGGAIRRYAMQNAIRLLWSLFEAGLLPFSDAPPLFEDKPDVSNLRLPAEVNSFVGRERDVDQIKRFLGSRRLVTLTGMGGVGKSRLVLQVAREVKDQYDDVAVVELAPISDPALVAQTVSSALGVREMPGKTVEQVLAGHLRAKKVLLVLDNCERLVAVCAWLCADLLRECHELHILATSRETLGIAAEQVFPVSPLETPAHTDLPDLESLMRFGSVILFNDRALSKRPDFSVTPENAPVVAQVCWRLDGIPLAIELAAARVRTLSIQQIADRLGDRFRLLTGGPSTALPHQQTMQATVDWSYDLLSEQEKALFQRLSVFAGGWTLEAAEAVCLGGEVQPQDVLDLLTSLSDKSLLQVDNLGDGIRYRMLETIHEYACDHLDQESEKRTVLEQHLNWSLRLALEGVPQLTGPKQAQWLNRLETEHDNFRAALSWRQKNDDWTDAALQLVAVLGHFWAIRGHLSEGRQWLNSILVLEGIAYPLPLRALALSWAGNLAYLQGDYIAAQAQFEQGLAIYQRLEDQGGIITTVGNLGNVSHARGDYEAAQTQYERGLMTFREQENQVGIATSLINLANLAYSRGNYGMARVGFEEVLAYRRETGDERGIANALRNLAGLDYARGNYGAAQASLEQTLAIYQGLGDQEGLATALGFLANVSQALGDYRAAQAQYEQGLAIFRQLGDQRGIATILDNLGSLAHARGDRRAAQARYEQGLAAFQKLEDQWGVATSLNHLGSLAFAQGDLTAAQEGYEKSLILYRRLGDERGVALSVCLLADVSHLRGDYAAARAGFEKGLATFREQGNEAAIATTIGNLARVAHSERDYREARAGYEQSLVTFRKQENQAEIATTLGNLAALSHEQSDTKRAARLYGAAEKLHEVIGTPQPSNMRQEYRNLVSMLGEEALTRAWAEGRAMALEQAVEYALSTSE